VLGAAIGKKALYRQLWAIGYFISTFLAAYDKRGKETYFDEAPQEVSFGMAMYLRAMHRDWHIRTDDWGWIYRGHQLAENNQGYWPDHDVFTAILVSGGIVGGLWIFTALFELYKYLAKKTSIAGVVS
jgi:hypothetical protein